MIVPVDHYLQTNNTMVLTNGESFVKQTITLLYLIKKNVAIYLQIER